ncbi:hypothetical protein IFR05_000167 [Cadophora sp. M221]|nr:hypothetical protein IFR05_000167 [Cadophora sp. M221]
MKSSIVLFLMLYSCIAEAAGTCQPVKWSKLARRDVTSQSITTSSTFISSLRPSTSNGILITSSTKSSATSSQTATSLTSSALAMDTPTLFQNTSLITTGNITAGTVNCRSSAPTTDQVNYYTCSLLAITYGITVEKFFILNPTILPDCSNIKPNSLYCTAGYIEPVLAVDGFCGPLHKNASCVGNSVGQCCNSQIWTCGNSTSDCEPGICWEGICPGDKIYSTDGTCGTQNGDRLCAGKWGDCCNASGKCGTGSAFCGTSVCQSGNCTWPVVPSLPPPWLGLVGNTTDGTCGKANSFTCSSGFGNCCNKDGICGSLPSDCGVGCQPQWGNCDPLPSSSSTKPLSNTSKPSSTSSKISSSTKSSAITTSSSKPTTTSSTSTSKPISSTSKPTSSTVRSTTTSKTSSTASPVITAISALPSCGQTCFSNVIAQYSTLGCSSPDPSCLCKNANFGFGIRDCANGACGTSVGSTVIAYQSLYCSSAAATVKVTTTATGIAALPSCGQTCFNNLIAQYSSLGCSSPDPSCLCKNVNFGFGIRDCSNGACGTAVASTVIAFQTAYCASAAATVKPTTTATGIAALPSCGQTCFNNVIAQYSTLGCATPDPSCLCKNVNFGFGIRDCSNGACGTAVASTVIAYQSAYCSSAAATATAKPK